MIKEDFLQYIWQYKLFLTQSLKTTDGEIIEILDVGRKNTDAGPDFFNAKIKIENKTWAGNVEIHVQSSDWTTHKHIENDTYQSIILHVVHKANAEVKRKSGEKIPQLELKFPDELLTNYINLSEEKRTISCFDKLNQIPSIFISSWMNTLLSERLSRKTEHIAALLEKNKNNWEEAFYITLARNFGFGINGDAFERLAQSLPLVYLQKHKNSLFQLEALLFGQSGLLPTENKDEYVEKLEKEYSFLKTKFSLTPLQQPNWKLLRLRPVNFPHVRIAQFAALIHQSSKLFSKIIEKPDYDYICSLFTVQLSDYWETHYTFKQESVKRTKQLGKKAVDILIINTVAPFLFYYGKKNGNEFLQESALKLLEQVPPEKNNITEKWDEAGIKTKNAFDSQALIELTTNYCEKKDCLRCRIGHKVLTKK